MSFEQPKNETPEEKPIGGEDSEKFDAEGNPRTQRELPDGTIIFVSQKEYEEALDGLK